MKTTDTSGDGLSYLESLLFLWTLYKFCYIIKTLRFEADSAFVLRRKLSGGPLRYIGPVADNNFM